MPWFFRLTFLGKWVCCMEILPRQQLNTFILHDIVHTMWRVPYSIEYRRTFAGTIVLQTKYDKRTILVSGQCIACEELPLLIKKLTRHMRPIFSVENGLILENRLYVEKGNFSKIAYFFENSLFLENSLLAYFRVLQQPILFLCRRSCYFRKKNYFREIGYFRVSKIDYFSNIGYFSNMAYFSKIAYFLKMAYLLNCCLSRSLENLPIRYRY
jgi:hypothetical protein